MHNQAGITAVDKSPATSDHKKENSSVVMTKRRLRYKEIILQNSLVIEKNQWKVEAYNTSRALEKKKAEVKGNCAARLEIKDSVEK